MINPSPISELNIYVGVLTIFRQSHPEAHTHAITSLSIYPFDPTPSTIITTSHDTTLKLSSIGESSITPVHTFSLESTPYSHSFSAHPASTLLIAVGTSQKSVRLLDLRSGLSTHSLPGHDAAIPSVAWAPHNEHILASASADNRVIIFDIRRGGRSSAIATLDMDDAVGVLSPESSSSTQPPRKAFTRDVRAHNGIVTGVRWTSDGGHLITSGQDARIRVWDASTGANTLVHFGPRIRNSASSNLAERAPLILPNSLFTPGHETLLWPNYNDVDDRGEIYMFELREGTFIKQLKLPGISSVARQRQRAQQQNQPTALSAARINALAWRGNGSSGEGMEMFSAHGDGTIKAWVSQIPEEEEADDKEKEKEERKRKRDVLEEVYQGLMQPTVTFT